MRINFRLNNDKDKELVDYFNNCKNITDGAKYLMRKGLNGSVVPTVMFDEIKQIETPVVSNDDDILNNIMDTISMFNT